MPIYNFACVNYGCDLHQEVVKKIVKPDKDIFLCASCKQLLIRKYTGPSVSVKEVIDNGMMPRSVERHANVNELVDEFIDANEKDS